MEKKIDNVHYVNDGHSYHSNSFSFPGKTELNFIILMPANPKSFLNCVNHNA